MCQMIATGMTGELVAPLNFTGNRMKQKLEMPSRTNCSVTKFSIS